MKVKKSRNKSSPRLFYTNQELKTIARRFSNMRDLTKAYPNVANNLYQKKLIKKYTNHMTPIFRKHTNKSLAKIAKKYKTITEFQKSDRGAYMAASRRGILYKICSHMKKLVNYYTNRDLISIAKKYRRRVDFQKYDRSAYIIARKRGIIEQCFKHMIPKNSESKIPFEELQRVSKKYKYRSEFRIKDRNMYEVARRRNLLNKICSHMKLKPRELYVSEYAVLQFVKSIYPDAINQWFYNIKVKRRPYIKSFELDIFIPSLNKAIEFDGVYWHSKKVLLSKKRKWPPSARIKYHQIKDKFFLEERGIRILHITDHMWFKDKENTKIKIIEFLTS